MLCMYTTGCVESPSVFLFDQRGYLNDSKMNLKVKKMFLVLTDISLDYYGSDSLKIQMNMQMCLDSLLNAIVNIICRHQKSRF